MAEQTAPAASLVSVNVGLPKDVPRQGKTVHTGPSGQILICCAQPRTDLVLDM
jgi:hypothetical protein